MHTQPVAPSSGVIFLKVPPDPQRQLRRPASVFKRPRGVAHPELRTGMAQYMLPVAASLYVFPRLATPNFGAALPWDGGAGPLACNVVAVPTPAQPAGPATGRCYQYLPLQLAAYGPGGFA